MRKVIIMLATAALLASGCSAPDFFKDSRNHSKEKEKPQSSKTPWKDSPTLEAAYFNDIKVVDGKKIINNPYNELALVNKEYGLPSSYTPDDLVRANVSYSFGEEKLEKALLREDAAKALEIMFSEARKQGVELFAVSGYRSYDRQTAVFDAEVQRVGKEKAAEAVAFPGNSEHQTGLAMDISGNSVGLNLTEELGNAKEGVWLADNAYRFGYILRYPRGKEDITGYQYEPWHFRFVGKNAAETIYKNKWTLEEYFETVKKI
ncbi:M15 family metallopeptidase [Bacillus massilinigeriensis]|uniref:M15 family metallopeptidase n=1 Tax=Bacillus mediterraneensis TaxID=1805474 RepID=UPI0008F8BBB1|nr:M15 family metallopeptidase [Bacillus mediterraneensis]